MNSRYFFYGSDFKYALVDTFTRNIWLLAENEEIAHRIRQIFSWSKLNLIVVDISTYTNRDLIDNSVCLNWQVPEMQIQLLETTMVKKIFAQTHKLSGTKLINQHRKTNLSQSRREDLQQQLMLAYCVINGLNFTLENSTSTKFLDWSKLDISLEAIFNSHMFLLFEQICRTELTITELELELQKQLPTAIKTENDLYIMSLIFEKIGGCYY